MNHSQLNKTVLKLDENALKNAQNSCVFSFSPAVLETMSRLISIIAQLRSPAGGWPSYLPPTPENLLPYVTEEACEVLEVLQAEPAQKLAHFSQQSLVAQLPSGYIFLEDLIDYLLWYFAKTSELMVQLLSGVPAQIQQDNDIVTGTVRLVAILAAQNAQNDWQVDLATQQPVARQSPSVTIFPETLIQLQKGLKSRQFFRVSELIEQLWQEIHCFTPELTPFQVPISASWLEPGSQWQIGNLQLKLDLEFTPHPLTTESEKVEPSQSFYWQFLDSAFSENLIQTIIQQKLIHLVTLPSWQGQIDQATDAVDVSLTEVPVEPVEEIVLEDVELTSAEMPINPDDQLLDLEMPADPNHQLGEAVSELEKKSITLTEATEELLEGEAAFNSMDAILMDEVSLSAEIEKNSEDFILENQDSTKTDQILSEALTEVVNLENLEEKLADELLLKLVSLADDLTNTIQVISTDNPVQLQLYPLPLDDVIHQLLWHLIRSRYEIMQLVGGVSAGMVQPNLGWMEGILKLRPTLKALHQNPSWEIDLTTGQMPPAERLFVLPEAVICSHALPCLHQPVEAQILLKQWIEHLSDTIPEVAQWIAGVTVEWQISEQSRHSATLQLNLALEFQQG
jgi:NTP pyrophosphatase (non-canonical NTP hydrolase)